MNNTPDQPEETTEVDTPAPAPAVAEIANAEPKQTADVADDPKSAINGTWCGTQNIQHFEGDENTVAYRYEVKDGMLQTYRMNVGASWARTSCSSSDSCVDGRDSEWQEIGICPVEYKEGRFSDTGTKYIEVFCEDKMPFDTVVLDLVSGDIGLRHATKPIDLKPCSSFE